MSKPRRKNPRTRIRKVTLWRDKKTGKFMPPPKTAKQKKRRKKSTMVYRTTTEGRYFAGIKAEGEEIITKKAGKGELNQWGGLIGDTFDAMNVTSTIMKPDSAFVDVTISGRVKRGKKYERTSLRLSLDLRDVGHKRMLREVLIGKVTELLHSQNLRTQYEVELIKGWSKKKTRRYEARSYSPIEDATITAVIRKR